MHTVINIVYPTSRLQEKFNPNVISKYIYFNLVLKAVKNPVRSQSTIKVPDQVLSRKMGKQSRTPVSTPSLPTASLWFSHNGEEEGGESGLII